MAARRAYVSLALLGLLGCDRLLHRHAPDASSGAVADASSAAVTDAAPDASEVTEADDEDEATGTDGGSACPLPVHPDYCRRTCKSYPSREATKHANRIAHAARVGLGTCGAFKVFAEDEQAGDAGVASGIVEFFDTHGALVGALDTRSKRCGKFGEIPACTPVIAWERPPVSIREGVVTVSSNQLPIAVLQRIVRQSYGRFKVCAANGKPPTQEGRVVTKLALAKDGSVTSAEDDGSDVADKKVVACVVHVFATMAFPEPAGGPATVTYPIVFSR